MRFGPRLRRLHNRVRRAIWVVPSLYAVLAVIAGGVLVRWDERDPVEWSWGISPSSAATALSSLATGMLAFTGFVTSVVLMIVQFGSTQFSSRFVRWFRSEPSIRHGLGTFVATFLFALIATALTGGGPTPLVPYRSLLAALLLTLASVGWFLALLSRTSDTMRVAHVVQRVDEGARAVFDTVYPHAYGEARSNSDIVSAFEHATPVQSLRHRGVGAVLQTFDRRALLQLATQTGTTIEMVLGVGEHVPTDGTVLHVYGAGPLPERKLRSRLSFGDERTVEEDPAFMVRMLVDVAIRALSPAVNDPTTAVQSLHRIEDMLRYAGAKQLSTGVVTDDAGKVRLIYQTPTWEDLCSLALDEIRACGAGQYQIARRLRALIDDLLADLPQDRHPTLRAQMALLDGAVAAAFPDAAQRAAALVADRQGLGLSRPVLP